MLTTNESADLEAAGRDLLQYILHPAHWVPLTRLAREPWLRPGSRDEYQRQVGALRICASVDVAPTLDAYLRVGFRAPGLTPARAADLLEAFLTSRLPLLPNTEWQVEVDAKKWIHFIRRYVGPALRA